MKHLTLILTSLLLISVTLSACEDGGYSLYTELTCGSDYTIGPANNCPSDAPYSCSEDGSCHATFDGAYTWCDQQNYQNEQDCKRTYETWDAHAGSHVAP